MEESIISALARAKLKFEPVTRSETADTGKYKYKYATLDQMIQATEKALSEEGLVVWHTMALDGENKFAIVRASLRWAGSPETLVAEAAMPFPAPDGRMNPAQALGSILTYGRRYSYGALLGIAIEDDDDAARTPDPKGQPKKAEPPAAPREKKLSEILKDAGDAGYLTPEQRKAYFDEATRLVDLAKATGKSADLSDLTARVLAAIESGKALAANPELIY